MDARGPETEEDKLKEAVVGYLEECFSNDLPEDQKIVIGHLRYLCDDPNQRIVIPIKTGYTAIGSAPILPERLNSDIQIAMRGVSARHALLEVSPDGTERFIEDLFSTNFTCFGPTEYRLAPRRCYELTDGKIILFGPVRFEFTLVDEVRLAIQRADAAARGTLGPPRAEDRVAIAYTGITETDALREIREALGGELVDDWREATHLVTDRVRRTVKFLAALLAGKHIVGPRYVEACAREGRWCPVQAKHLVKDAKMQREYGFTLCKSIKAAAARPLFQGLTFYVTPHVTPPGATLGEMINAGQGKTVSAIGPDVPGANIIVIGCPEDAAECDALRQRGFRIVDREFILTGSLRQELNYTGHALSP